MFEPNITSTRRASRDKACPGMSFIGQQNNFLRGPILTKP